jgi:gluconate:H+ symporter, GntP family
MEGPPLFQILFFLIVAVSGIVILTVKYKVHAFFALMIACLIVGFGVGFDLISILNTMKEGFGTIMKSLALVIILGTTLGILMEESGCTDTITSFILSKVGRKRTSLAMSLAGFVVGLPIFCDSGFIVLSGLNHSLVKRTGIPMKQMAVSLATGLYAVHCLVPPHPGATAASSIIGADLGKLIISGIVVAIPAMLAANLWAACNSRTDKEAVPVPELPACPSLRNVFFAVLPLFIPILLITLKSFLSAYLNPYFGNILNALGDPVAALGTGVLIVLITTGKTIKSRIPHVLSEAAEKAGGILVIIGSGGAFGAILARTHIGELSSQALPVGSMGILFPFLITSMLKTAQGSSTVAIITASSLVLPLLQPLGLATSNGRLLCVLSMGAGSMMISHANDAYFWVIAKFSGLNMKTMLRTYSCATIIMGVLSLLMVYLLSFFLNK